MSAGAGKIAVLDFGGQYTQLIARRVREMSVYSEIFSCTHPLEQILAAGYQGIILSGGPSSVYEEGAPLPPKELFDAGIPVLGICYGMQAMGYLLGGHVIPAERREYGKAEITLQGQSPLLRNVEPEASGRVTVWMSHGDTVLRPPKGFTSLASTPNCPVAAMADEVRHLYAVQFHPEVLHTPQGRTILDNFLTVCGVSRTWSMAGFIDTTVEAIRAQVGSQRVLCALSGGVDSSVVAVLIHRAIGDQLTCVFVDNGLLRKGEAEAVVHTFRDAFKMNLIHVDASRRFLDEIRGVTDPEIKRKRIGAEFIAVFEDEAKKLGDIPFLAQGTLYPDVIESVSFRGPSATIKTHHNVGGLPLHMQFTLVEPLRELFKDEVRKLGELLGLPPEIVWRQPFPGPGLAIRVLGEVTSDRLDLLREADAIVQEEVREAGLERTVWQAFAVLLPIKTVGVMGDFRTYAHVVALRAVMSQDAMTADWARLPYELLGTISNRIINEVKGINRVVFDISSKPPSTIEWE
jgi:GMP synthase (glutamine-hydrolysing)